MSEAQDETERLVGKAALVTGASSGLGRATAIALARSGADVALVARSAEELESAKEEVSEAGHRALSLPTDQRTVEEFGRIDVLVNAAGTDAPGTIEELDLEGWDRTLDVNLRAPFLLSKAAFPRMREAGGGMIVNISSVAGKKRWANAYCASKFGLTGLTEALADEGKAYGIRAIVLYPGAMATNWGDLLSRGAPGGRIGGGSADPCAPAGACGGSDRVAGGVTTRVRLDGRDRAADRRTTTVGEGRRDRPRAHALFASIIKNRELCFRDLAGLLAWRKSLETHWGASRSLGVTQHHFHV